MTVLKFIKQTAWPFRLYFLGNIAVLMFYAIHMSLRPYLIKLLIDSVATHTGTSIAGIHRAWWLATIFILLQIWVFITWRFYDWCVLKYDPALRNNITRTLVNILGYHSHSFFQNHFAGSLTSKINDAAMRIPLIIKTIIDHFLASIMVLLIALYALWHIHVGFALALLIWSGLFILLSISIINRSNYLVHQIAESIAQIIGYIVDFLGNMSSVMFFVGKPQEQAKLDALQEAYLQSSQKRQWFLLTFYSARGLLFTAYQAFCVFFLIYLYGKNQVTPGDFAMILTLNLGITDVLWETSNQLQTFSEHWGSVDLALKTIGVPIEVQDKPNASDMVVTKGEIVFDQVHFQYPGAEPLFENKSVVIASGQKVGLVGYSGGGKSTFANLILRLFDVSSGRILIDGQDVREVTQDSLRRAIGVIPQDPSLFHRTLRENIRYGRLNASDAEVVEAAKHANAHGFIMDLPHGYDSLVGERGIKLSGGQRQRIAIARAFLKNAPILILDEATSQLDSVTENYIQESLWELMQGKTTIVIAHRLSTLLHMDRILVFDNGKIVEDGMHQELLAKEGLYSSLWKAQVGRFLVDL